MPQEFFFDFNHIYIGINPFFNNWHKACISDSILIGSR